MSDFTSNFWSLYVAGIALVGIVACLLLLYFSGKAKAMTANDNTTGHVWDGDLREMNNPLPRWWVGLFLITIVFALGYLALYPGLGTNVGKLGWSSAGQYDAEVAKANKELEPLYAKFSGMPPEEVAKDPQAMAIGDRLFMNNCAQCHGSDARGSKGFPNLTDTDWLHGEAVAAGMLIAADMSARIGLLPRHDVQRIAELLQRTGLATPPPRMGAERALHYMSVDKKVRAGRIRLVLLRALGAATFTADYPDGALSATLAAHFD